jgi:hypothetical protein
MLTSIVLISSQSSIIEEAQYPTPSKEEALLKVLEGYKRPLLEAHLYLNPGRELADRRRTLIQLLSLQYLRCHLALNGNFMDMIGANYYEKQREHIDPRKMSLTRSVLAAVMADAFSCEDLREHSLIVVGLLDSLLDIIPESMGDKWMNSSALRRLCAEVRAECSAQTRLITRIAERLESHLRFFERFRAINDSVSIGLLTLLACIFLPMSIASGILSMQTRFADLFFFFTIFAASSPLSGP